MTSDPEPADVLDPPNHGQPSSHAAEEIQIVEEVVHGSLEAEGHSIYVRNLPLNVTIAQLEVEFKRFGPIKQGVVQVRSNRQQGFCFGFVEFEDLSSMNRAIQASPVTIGGHQADVEIKRTTTRVGSGRGRFPSGRGGYRNDNFRGRGNFSGGRGYGRNDFVGEREFQVVEGVREDEVVKVTNKEEGEVVGEVA
ncbi:nuclear transport factor 2-like isoform X3 [Nicotiana sylvestris]|uniref:Cold-inducible RNA-binding protein B-like isoform X2 n=2 Tax=Nicotiana sylvestris TaxID=4096 RepID=A0A1U7Y142_NICSY|nr:PREDICTED: cold-inducible RNA-binding protein B-like isoform X2 [Nicotiana sylvestris]XP_009792499.1 PREDICTED: cold-inducible RNA-binding protein B-like isoform X2 [Nicotiana sylvestris]XP_009792500.1 PREDICTED: cold-inducible RNA-binding protein B-like isoform X2 [Nicotiana sylvestris]XP_009792501.1 PREDICTED: cold-inducible RNA-binding protein B-like isoform X2 [Nicotiana sylvestris]